MASDTDTLPLRIISFPLERKDLRLVGFTGAEAISQLFNFELLLLADKRRGLPFAEILGQPMTFALPIRQGNLRFFNGIVNRVSQGGDVFGDDGVEFTAYRLNIVPRLWLLTKKAQSRIFQHKSVKDILKEVLQGMDVVDELRGTYLPRDYCVQYRETDFNFASRLMEEEGISYHFRHTEDHRHQLVLADTQGSLHTTPVQVLVYFDKNRSGNRSDRRVYTWEKVQELRAGKYTLWDHCFELPSNGSGTFQKLEGTSTIVSEVKVGDVIHKLNVGGNDKLEIYDFPGEYAQRFDGVQPGGSDRPGTDDGHINRIFDKVYEQTAKIRMQAEALAGLVIGGTSNCTQFMAGHAFNLIDHSKEANGGYVLTGVQHIARQGILRSNGGGFEYSNTFACIPAHENYPYRPPRTTAKPFVQGTQTAVVVGSGGQDEEIFTDKYGRVKVRFHWDRRKKGDKDFQSDADRSCWIRVGTPWAGQRWGMIHIPRVGQEVIVAFEEGDPDKPIIVGSVYNYANMPPYELPKNQTQSGLKTRSSLKGTEKNFNELRFEDSKGSEDIYFHAEKDFHRVVENDDNLNVTNNQTIKIEKGKSTTEAKEGIELKVGQSSMKLEPTAITLQFADALDPTKQVSSLKLDQQGITLEVPNPADPSKPARLKLDPLGIALRGFMVNQESDLLTVAKSVLTQLTAQGLTMIK